MAALCSSIQLSVHDYKLATLNNKSSTMQAKPSQFSIKRESFPYIAI